MDQERTIILATEATGLRGRTIYTIHLARQLMRRGYRVVLLSPPDPLLQNADAHTEHLPLRLRHGHPSAPTSPALQRAIAERKPAVIHLVGLERLKAWHTLATRACTPLVASATSFLDKAARYERHTRPEPFFIATSEDVRANLVNAGKIPKDQVRLVPCGIETTDEDAHAHLPQNTVKVIGTISALEQHKGIETLLNAAAKLAERNVTFQLLIMGAGTLERRLRQLRAELNLGRHVTFVPPTSAYGDFLDDIDVFILPSDAQPMGQTVIEAMAHAKPVVATATGGVFSVITDRQDGLIVKIGDVDGIVDAFTRLLEDEDLRREMGQAARARVQQHFGIDPMVTRTLEVYREAGADLEPA